MKQLKKEDTIANQAEESELMKDENISNNDKVHANIWLIDFGKTVRLPENCSITHNKEWIEGNHEDGYLIGLNEIISLFEQLSLEVNREKDINETVPR